MSYKTIFFDLDDTLINTKNRHYEIYEIFCDSKDLNKLPFTEYLKARRDFNWSNPEILLKHHKLNSKDVDDFKKFWNLKIESLPLLQLDELIIDLKLLQQLAESKMLNLLSLRSVPQNAITQLESLGIRKYFSEIHFLSHCSTSNAKADFFSKYSNKHNIDFFIGDSLADLEAAEKNQVPFLPVATGIYKLSNRDSFSNINSAIQSIFKI